MQHVMLHAMWYDGTAPLSSLTEKGFILLPELLTNESLHSSDQGRKKRQENHNRPWPRVSWHGVPTGHHKHTAPTPSLPESTGHPVLVGSSLAPSCTGQGEAGGVRHSHL